MHRYFFAAVLSILCIAQADAQDVSATRHKPRLLKGNWQLARTYNDGVVHPVTPQEYDAVVTFRSLHRYSEEVKYEGYHWIIKGRWKTLHHKNTLLLTKRTYVSGSLGDVPQDITFSLYRLDKNQWAGDTPTKAGIVKMEYEKIIGKVK